VVIWGTGTTDKALPRHPPSVPHTAPLVPVCSGWPSLYHLSREE